MNYLDYIKALFQFIWQFVANVLFVLTGLLMVAIAIPFRVKGISVSDGRPIVNLPRWAFPWGNDFDGLEGDKRLWWAQNTPFKLPVDHFISMYVWAAIRNPANNMRMMDLFQAPVVGSTIVWIGDAVVEDDAGETGCQFVKTTNSGRNYYGFYLVKPYKNGTHAFVVRLGFKVQPDHIGSQSLPKGIVTKISFWKEL